MTENLFVLGSCAEFHARNNKKTTRSEKSMWLESLKDVLV